MKLEHTLQFSGEGFQSLKGASAALQAFRQGNQTDDEDNDGFCTFLGQIPSYIGSWLAKLLRQERALDFLCAGVSPPATTTIINMNTQLPVHENNVAPQTARMLFLIIPTILALFTFAQKANLAQEFTHSRKDQQIERLHSVSPPPIRTCLRLFQHRLFHRASSTSSPRYARPAIRHSTINTASTSIRRNIERRRRQRCTPPPRTPLCSSLRHGIASLNMQFLELNISQRWR
jgi:hypothetical protein